MAKRASVSAPNEETENPVADSVDRLTAEVRVLRDVLDEIREDFSWVTRNGLPVQPVIHTRVKRMALDPCADDWGERLEIESCTLRSSDRQRLDADALGQLVDSLTRSLESAAQGQLEIVLSALDTVRAEILNSLHQRSASDATPTADRSAATKAPKPPPGQLF